MLDRLMHAGDPTFIGWVNTLLYFVLAGKAYLRFTSIDQDRLKRQLWLVIFILFLSLGLNKQLDLHADLINVMKSYVIGIGFEQYKYPLKMLAALFGALVLVLLLFLIQRYLTASIRRHKLMPFGLVILFFFVFCRLVAFDHLFAGRAQFAVEYYTVYLELPSLLIILVGLFDRKLH